MLLALIKTYVYIFIPASVFYLFADIMKKIWNIDGQHFHQYQQNEQSHHLTHWTQKRPRHMTLKIKVLAWDRHTNVAELNRLIGSQQTPLDNMILNGHTYKQAIKNLQIFASTHLGNILSQKWMTTRTWTVG